MNMTLCRQLVALDLEIQEAEAKLKDLKAGRKVMEGAVLDEWVKEQPRNVALAEGPTLTMRRDIHISKRGGVSSESLVEALKEAGLEWITNETYSAARLKAYVKEQEREAEEERNEPVNPEDILPDAVKALVSVHESNKIVVMNKGKS